MNITKTIVMTTLFAMTLPASQSLAAYSQVSDVISGGGGLSSSGLYTLTGTIGQPVVGLASGTNYTNQSGFWNIRTGDTIPPSTPDFVLQTPVRSLSMPFNVPITTLGAIDGESSVTGYYLSSSTTPPVDAWGAGWSNAAPDSLLTSTKGGQTHYVWARDAAGNISPMASAPTETIFQWLLGVSMAGSGGVSISANPGIVACPSNCNVPIDEGTSVALSGNPDVRSQLANWSGSISSTANPASLIMDGDKNITGTFALVSSPARIVYDKGYASLLATIQALSANSSIEARDTYPSTQTEPLLFDKGYTVSLAGGKNANWDTTAGFTSVKGTLKVAKGRVNLKGGIKLHP